MARRSWQPVILAAQPAGSPGSEAKNLGMSSRPAPIIGLTCIEIRTDSGPRHPPRFGQNQAYIQAVIRAGAAPLLIPQGLEPNLLRTLYGVCDGLLLPGGEDVGPASYGESVHEKCGRFSLERDAMELSLARWAIDEGKPLLAVCRGTQVLNVALGGSLYQDVATQCPGAGKHDWFPGFPRNRLSHTAIIDPQARLAWLMDATSLPVNSLHHQALKDVAPRLAVTARAPDGVIEAVEASDHPFAIGVQWHPEELAAEDARAQRLLDALVDACRK